MPFGLIKTPSTLMTLMNEVIHEFIGKFVMVYLDDILISNNSKEEHMRHLELVIQRWKEVSNQP